MSINASIVATWALIYAAYIRVVGSFAPKYFYVSVSILGSFPAAGGTFPIRGHFQLSTPLYLDGACWVSKQLKR